MLNFSKILFPVDFSNRCLATAHYAGWVARRLGAHVTMLHAMHIVEAAPISPYLHLPACQPFEDLIRIHETALADFAPAAFEGVPVTYVVEPGEAAEVITCYAKTKEIDLIMMPTHGLGKFRWLLLGSVTAKVLNDASCPVWTTVHSESLYPPEGDIRVIVCGVDIYSDPVRVIRAASDIAAAVGGVVRLVHAIGAPEAKSGRELDAPLKRYLVDSAREEIDACQQKADVHWEVCVEGGDVASVLRDAASQSHSDLVVVGRGHLHSHFGRFRTHIGGIIRESPCPVLSI